MAHRQEDWCAQSRDKYAELNRQFCQKLALAQQTLAQPDLSGFHEMEEGLHRLEESFGEKPAAEKNAVRIYFTSWQNRSISSARDWSPCRQKALSVRSMPAILAVSSTQVTEVAWSIFLYRGTKSLPSC